MHVLAAVDKFRGTATAAEVASVICEVATKTGHTGDPAPVSDGGEGWLEAFGGPNRYTRVTGPLGDDLRAPWRLENGTAVIEMAQASGLLIAGGAEHNDPMAATTTGTGDLIDAALDAGADRIIVGLGGSATTDGGFGAVRALRNRHRLRGVEMLIACDVRTKFTDAARVFGPQKGATPAQVGLLTGRLERLVQMYREEFGVDVSELEGAGAAGGLAGGLVALGGRLVPGFDLLADEVRLAERASAADLIITGEGYLDEQSFEGKVVGGMADLGARCGARVVAITGDIDPEVAGRIEAISLVQRFGDAQARGNTLVCLRTVVTELLATP